MAMVAAIEIYNKPSFPYRNESFAILAINGWELLLKAKWLAMHKHRKQSLYVYTYRTNSGGEKSKNRFIKKTRSQTPLTLDLGFLIKKLVESKDLNPHASRNIELLMEFRDNATHFYNDNPTFKSRIYEIGAACVKNFAALVHVWFDRKLSEFDLHLMPLSFIDPPSHVSGHLLNAEEKRFLAFLDGFERHQSDPESPFAVTLNVELKFTKSKADGAIPTVITGDPSALPVRLTEESVRERYPWNYAKLTAECNKRYRNFKINGKYHKARKHLLKDKRYGHLRFLDPGNERSTTKAFYDPNILVELDKLYAKQ